ncbi:hypothetical protein U9M48_026297 [Paspalum notatum var. saurae]|uniref:Uncharacterized protein n=1 Tax=Paspalum notatum var. saurae TaxID=547442 RepID=A0AAQ3WY70_PASNO
MPNGQQENINDPSRSPGRLLKQHSGSLSDHKDILKCKFIPRDHGSLDFEKAQSFEKALCITGVLHVIGSRMYIIGIGLTEELDPYPSCTHDSCCIQMLLCHAAQGPSCPSLMRLQISEHSIRLTATINKQMRCSSLWLVRRARSRKGEGAAATSFGTYQYCRLRKPSLNTTSGLRTAKTDRHVTYVNDRQLNASAAGTLPPDVEWALAGRAADAGADALGGALQRLGRPGVLDPLLLPVAPCALASSATHYTEPAACCRARKRTYAPESVGGTLEKVSGWGAGVERMAARASATAACAAIPVEALRRRSGAHRTAARRRRRRRRGLAEST